jgi:uncharacterized protein YecT (DUF1311 family)
MTMFARAMIGAAIALIVTASAAAAQDCANSDSTTEMNRCYTKLLAQADADLKAKYDDVNGPVKHLSMLDQGMTKAEEAWITYRDQTCEVARLKSLGTQFETVAPISCRLTLTRERISDLDNQFNPLFDAKH